jgi:SAM-dependent methyltransferase
VKTGKSWERLGASEPYFGVLAAPKFAGSQLGAAERAEFFRTGEQHVEKLMAVIRARDPAFRPKRALDFGCGVGRVTIPLARQSATVMGADVSASVLTEARNNAAGLNNVEFVQSGDALQAVQGSFDLIHSFIVFQHIPPNRGMRLVAQLLDRLEPGGWGALHFVYAVEASHWQQLVSSIRSRIPLVHVAINLIRGHPPRRPFMQMNPYPLDRLFLLLQERGCHEVTSRFSRHGDFPGVMLLFRRTKLPLL